jgi:hypothetical protein
LTKKVSEMTRYLTALLLATSALAAPAAQAQVSGFSAFAPANGSAVNNGASLILTNNGGSEGGSAFAFAPQNISDGFHASFVYVVGGDAAADGFTFTLQNDPRTTSALGAGGGYLGYGGGTSAITNSVAVEFNFNQSNSTGLGTNGSIGTPTNILNGVSLASGQPILISLGYDGSVLTESLMQSGNTFTVNYAMGSLQTVLGGPNAYVGFTGSDGGGSSTQTVSGFSFQNSPAAVPEASTLFTFSLLLVGLTGALVTSRKKSAILPS